MSEDRLVSARSLVCAFRSVAMEYATRAMTAKDKTKRERDVYTYNCMMNIADLLEDVDLSGVEVDAVPREEHELLVRRLEHLLNSDYIRSFDEKDIETGKYKRDIRDADRERVYAEWREAATFGSHHVCQERGVVCSYCCELSKHRHKFCPSCGAKMGGCD